MNGWIAELGQFFLMLAFALCLYQVVIGVVGIRKRIQSLVSASQVSTYVIFASVTAAMVCLGYALASSRFELVYVAKVTNHDLPLYYKIAALWSGQAGSLMLWTWLLTVYGALATYLGKKTLPNLLPYATLVIGGTAAFFLALNLFAANPFQVLREVFPDGTAQPFIPVDGRGLNPLLQHPVMTIHPPILYLGFVGFVIPFAFAIAALITRQVDSTWVASIRKWTLVSWLFLGVGIILGGLWAYVELGWGGYWAWDPVENASILPWFTATAFVHSIIVQQRRGMLKGWNFTLIISTYLLCIFGTFLTRSGIVSSVHAFGKSAIGPFFAIFLAISAVLSFGLLWSRRKDLKGDHRFTSTMSRESSFLYNNFLFMLACVAVLGGTMFPVFSEWVTGEQITLSPEFFNRVFIPIGLLIVLFMGIGPLLAWRSTPSKVLRRNFIIPAVAGLAALPFAWWTGARTPYTILSIVLSIFVTVAIEEEFRRSLLARKKANSESLPVAFVNLFRTNQRRYGGYVVHLGIVVIALGLTGAAFNTTTQGDLAVGDQLTLGSYQFKCSDIGIDSERDPNYATAFAQIDVLRNGNPIRSLHPEKRFYYASEQTTSEVALHSSLQEDIYVVMAGLTENDQASIMVYRNPLVAWIWLGGIVMIIGTGIALIPARREQEAIANDAAVEPGAVLRPRLDMD